MPGTNTNTLTSIFTAIANAIRSKTGGTASITPANMASEISGIYQGFDYRGVSGLKFCDNTDTSIDLSALNTASFTSMSSMFRGCNRLTSLDVSNFNTSNVTNMNNLFWSCEKITSLDVSNFNTSNVTAMGNFCNACKKLTSLDLSSFNTSRVTNMGALVSNCTQLTSINLQSFTTTAATTMDNMFKGSSALTDVIWAINSTTVQPLVTAKGWDLVADTVPTTLNIWVRDELLNDYKTATNWSRYANCFKKISELPSSLQTLYNIDPTDYYTPTS